MRSHVLVALLSSSLVYGGLIQNPNLSLPATASGNLSAVVDIFKKSYASYKRVLLFQSPDSVSNAIESSDGRNGWGASLADAMSTMYIMGLDDYFEEAVAFISNVDFSESKTSDTVRSVSDKPQPPIHLTYVIAYSVFETTIRYLAGMLSAYELSNYTHPALLQKATQLTDKMAYAWVGNNAIPYGYIDFSSDAPTQDTSNIAEAGTLTLEWGTLSKYTSNETYRQLAEQSVRHIASLSAPLPGLPAQGIDPSTGQSVGGYVTWGGGSDSYFEYLIKYARLNGSADDLADYWHQAVDSSISTLLRTSTVGDFTYLADYDDGAATASQKIRHVGSHLECFHGGNWLFGGKLLNNDTIVQIALDLVDACWNTYASTATGIGPEVFAYVSSDGDYTGGDSPTVEQLAFNTQHGFYITASDYILRPEVLESNFYAWRVSGDTKYVDRAAAAVKSFNTYLSVNGAYAGLNDVNNATITPDTMVNDMESFWFAEVLKYLYLTFDDPEHISLDEYVFNTEAHPFKLSAPNAQYGNNRLPTSTSGQTFRVNSGETPEVSQIPGLPSLKDIIQGTLNTNTEQAVL
ncbi:hypothetical protein H0H92_005572 [Tricholoma furcatifolium]|nr:hypothetical protein H0H92_005572 [Tricholoma furcatifolium]